MNVHWPRTRCILCTKSFGDARKRTKEHIIPEMIGGRLTCSFLCKKCNDRLGQHEAELKKDPSVRQEVSNLQSTLPRLFDSVSERQIFTASAGNGRILGLYQQGRFRASTRQTDGSVVRPIAEGLRHLANNLRKRGASEGEIQDNLRRIEIAEDCGMIRVTESLSVRKITVENIEPLIDERFGMTAFEDAEESLTGPGTALLKIAFEFLALHIEDRIMDSRYDFLREALDQRNPPRIGTTLRSGFVRGPVTPFHGLAIKEHSGYPIILIRLFGRLVYYLGFPEIPADFQRFSYKIDLSSRKEFLETMPVQSS